MSPEIRDFIARSDYYKGSVRELAAMLPVDDAELDSLIGEAVAASDQIQFIFLVMAALSTKRPVQARHLSNGTRLMPDKHSLGTFVRHMQGDVAAPLLEGLRNSTLPTEIASSALFLAARWFQENGQKIASGLIGAAHVAARTKTNTPYDLLLIYAVGSMGADAGLTTLTVERLGLKPGDPNRARTEESAKELGEQMLKIWQEPPFELLCDAPDRTLAMGETMRRAAARVGRNDPCPCGSGQKYKRCCIEKDQERLHHSTNIPGVTQLELRANPERYLTALDLDTYPAHDVARFDPLKVSPELWDHYFANLCRAKLFDACVDGFEKLGNNSKLGSCFNNVLIRIAQARRKDLVDRMLKVRPEAREAKLGALELFLNEEDLGKATEFFHQEAMVILTQPDAKRMVNFSRALLKSHLCAFGILVARGAIPLLPPMDGAALLEELLVARDGLNLSPDDPISDVLDKQSIEKSDEGADAAALREAQDRLGEKIHEVKRYRDSVERLEKELLRRERRVIAPSASAPVIPEGLVDEAALKEMRQQVESLKEKLKDRHHERNELRRNLQKAQIDLETFREKATFAAPKEPETPDREDELLLPQDAPEVHPVRLIEFPKSFQQTLNGFPRQVARAAMVLIGRLAGGEPAAFVGALRLKQVPNVMRQRIGTDYRLLFRLHSDHLQVIDFINRKDFDRRLKTLV